LLAQADRASPAINAATTPALRNLRKTLVMPGLQFRAFAGPVLV
jgi:hypothetical protein